MTEITEQPQQEVTLIKGHGVSNPEVVFIADHPYGEDFKTGYALTGNAESSLRGLLSDVGLFLGSYYRTTLIKTEVPLSLYQCAGNKGGTKKYVESSMELAKGHLHYLVDELNGLNPNLLVPLGEISFSVLTGLQGIRKFRGSILQTSPLLQEIAPRLNKQIKVLPALGPHPYLFRDYATKFVTRLDFSRIPRYSNDSQPPESLIRPWVCRSAAALRAFIERCYKPDGFLVFDIETYLQIPVCISFSFDGIEACCVPLLDQSIDKDTRALFMMLVGKLLASPIAKGNQNIKYDWKIMQRWGFIINNIQDDSNLAAGCIYPEFPKNLGFLTSIYTELPYFKDEGGSHDPQGPKQKDQYYLYNAKDSIADWQIIHRQRDEMFEMGTNFVYRKLMALQPIFKRMEERGLRVDDSVRQSKLAKYSSLFNIETLKLRSLANESSLNPLSSVQMNRLVFQTMGYELGRYVEGTDEDSLKYLMANDTHRSYTAKELLQCILNCRKIHKVLEILELDLHPDGRFRWEANLVGAETGRSTGGKTTDQLLIMPKPGKIKLSNLGHSMQTIGKHGFQIDGKTYGQDVREMYVPSRGFVFVEPDLSGAEARVDRVLSGNFDMGVFTNPGIHKLTGSWLYNCQPSEIKKKDLVNGVDRYHISKTVRHSAERNIGANTLVTMIEQSKSECQKLLNRLHENEPQIRRVYHKDIIDAINETRCLIKPNGRRRDFFGRPGHEVYNEAFSDYPQAIVADQLKFEGILPTFTEMPWAELLVEAHDGILAEVPIGRDMEFLEQFKANVETGIDFRVGSIQRDYELVIPCELSKGENWYAMEEVG